MLTRVKLRSESVRGPQYALDSTMTPAPETTPLDSLRSAFEQWHAAALAAQVLAVRFLGATAILAAGHARFDALTRAARARSPFYRDAWRHLPAGALKLADLPVVTKCELMAHFDQWSPTAR